MLALVVALTLSQADGALTPPPPPPVIEAVEEPAPTFKPTAQRKAGLFTEPRVEPGTLMGRVGLGALTGLAGGAVGAGFVFLGVLLSFTLGGLVPGIISGVLAGLSVATGNALGAAAFGRSYGRDFVDTFLVSLGTALVSALFVVGAAFFQAAMVPLLIIAALLPVSTPLWVQLIKAPSDEVTHAGRAGAVLAAF